MSFFVYMIVTKQNDKLISYVGYTKDIINRVIQHNTSKGAKFTKGKQWHLIYIKKYNKKVDAMKNEYKLKKNYKLRSKIKLKFLKDDKKNIHNFTI